MTIVSLIVWLAWWVANSFIGKIIILVVPRKQMA
jgi:hypothetical protein